jgi:hypothetical protein
VLKYAELKPDAVTLSPVLQYAEKEPIAVN